MGEIGDLVKAKGNEIQDLKNRINELEDLSDCQNNILDATVSELLESEKMTMKILYRFPSTCLMSNCN